ncbi:MAG: hypothetical protein FWG25_04950 [Promicromonosporaceae bacterium]|nr:hypothetical protein [Promicromonosporaceae bacterium]
MRVYLPATFSDLARVRQGPNGTTMALMPSQAWAVTPALTTELPGAEVEELEWRAFDSAAADSLALVVDDPNVTPLRAVISLDVPDQLVQVTPERGSAAVRLSAVPKAHVAAVHVDEPAAAPLISAVRATPESESAWQAAHNADLLWYDGTEVASIPTL